MDNIIQQLIDLYQSLQAETIELMTSIPTAQGDERAYIAGKMNAKAEALASLGKILGINQDSMMGLGGDDESAWPKDQDPTWSEERVRAEAEDAIDEANKHTAEVIGMDEFGMWSAERIEEEVARNKKNADEIARKIFEK